MIQAESRQGRRLFRRRGSILMIAMVFMLLTSVVMAAAIALVTSHNVRADREADYAAALQTAEAGANWEFWYISRNQNSTIVPPAHTITNPYTGIVPGYAGVFQVYVSNADDPSVPWTPPNKMVVHATGTVGGVSRRIHVSGTKQSLFNEFSLFGTKSISINGNDSTVNGTLGTNGVLASSSVGTAAISMTVTYCGPNASGPTGNNVLYEPDPVPWPTVDELVAKTFPNGWADLTNTSSTYRSNSKIRQYTATNPSLTPSGTESLGWSKVQKLNVQTMKDARVSADGYQTIIFPPGDYYIESIDLSGQYRFIFDTEGLTTTTGPGLIRVWMPAGNNSGSKMNIDLEMTSTDRSRFRMYYNSKGSMDMQGVSKWYGCFYGIRADGLAEVKLAGGSIINGSVIADKVVLSGGSMVNYPMDAEIGNDADYSLWYGFRGKYVEIPPASGAAVFADGSEN